MNRLHRRYCNSENWAMALQRGIMPWALEGVDLGNDLLEIGPGPGRGTEWLKERVERLTAIEIDERLAAALAGRCQGTNVSVVKGDATRMEFPEASFSGAVSFIMLHHVPSAELQDRLLAETYRVLRPGGAFAGADSIPNLMWNLYHVFDTRTPVDHSTFASRLERAGFVDVEVTANPRIFRFRARKPA